MVEIDTIKANIQSAKTKLKVVENTRSLKLKDTVNTGGFLGLIAWILYTMSVNGLIGWLDWTDNGFKIAVGIIAFAVCMVIGWDRAGVMATMGAILKVVFDPRMDNVAKLAFIKEAIEKLIGIGLAIETVT